MPHPTAAHKKILVTGGGYTGGVRPSTVSPPPDGSRIPDRIDPPKNQTTFAPWGEPIYPEPQSIVSMPYQNAGYSDDFNTRAQRANLEGVNIYDTKKVEDLIFNKDQIYVVPSYMKDFDDVGNDPDSEEYVSNYRGPKSLRQMENVRFVARGVRDFADSLGKYFDKEVIVMNNPYDYKKVPASTRAQIVFVGGSTYYSGENPPFTGSYSPIWGGRPTQFERVARFKEDRSEVQKVTQASSEEFTLNTNLNPKFDYLRWNYPRYWGNVALHEYGHALNFDHPTGYRNRGQQNSIMSYSRTRDQARFEPVDINAIKSIYEQALRERDAAKRASQNRLTKGKRPERK
jgi:hypothetical protein